MIDLAGKDQKWWPDLSGQTVAILAAGPSITKEQCDVARGRGWYAIAINETWRIAQWAPARYGCDWQWWRTCRPRPDEFKGLCILGSLPNTNARRPHLAPDMRGQAETLRYVPVRAGYGKFIWTGRDIGAGSNSAFQAANLASRWGASRLVLLGVDCHSPNRHWHGNHNHPEAPHQKKSLMKTWIRAWEMAKPQLIERKIEVINCSPGSALKAFPMMRVEDVPDA